jgi:ABC-type polysaccharide/polyol phosphate transport system ATPase subunit
VSAVVVDGVSKCFRVYGKPADHLKEILTLGRRRFHTEFWALRDVRFTVERGQCLGIIGENGSGKSTLLRIIAGVIRPNSGRVSVDGRVSALLELGAGFNPEFTGRDNVVLNASILGLSDGEIRSRMPRIEEFAGIGDFIDRPVKTYSSGMFVRLAFAVAIHVDPEVLIVDEALAVGDIYFQQRCIRTIQSMKSAGVTILFVSHDLSNVRTLADQAIWMDHGEIRMMGPTDGVAADYMAAMIAKGNRDLMGARPIGEALDGSGGLEFGQEALGSIPEFIHGLPNVDRRYGNGKARIAGIGVFNHAGRQTGTAAQGDRICVRVSVEFVSDVGRPNVGFMLRNRLGEDVFGTNLLYEGQEMSPAHAGDRVSVDFVMDLPYLRAGYYHLSPAVADGSMDNYEHCDWVDNAFALEVAERSTTYGHMRVPVRTGYRIVSRGRGEAAPDLRVSGGESTS